MTLKLQERVNPVPAPSLNEEELSQVEFDRMNFSPSLAIQDDELLRVSTQLRTDSAPSSLSNEEALRRVLDITKTYEASDTRQLLQIVGITGVTAETKVLALSAIAKEGDRSLVPELQGLLRSETDPEARFALQLALGQLGDNTALQEAAHTFKSERMYEALLRPFIPNGGKVSPEFYEEFSRPGYPTTARSLVIREYFRIDPESAKRHVAPFIAEDQVDIAETILSNIAQDRSPLAGKILMDALSNPHRFLRGNLAAEIQEMFPGEDGIKQLAAFLRQSALDSSLSPQESQRMGRYATDLESCERLNIRFPLRFSPDVLHSVVQTRQERDPSKPIALVIAGRYDFNNSLTENDTIYRDLLNQGFQVIYYEAESEQDFLHALKEGSGQAPGLTPQPASLLFISAHGETGRIQLGDNPQSEAVLSSQELRAFGQDPRTKELLMRSVASNGSVIFDSCFAGKGGEANQDNMANAIEEAFPQVVPQQIFSPTAMAYIRSITITDHQVQEVKYERDAGNSVVPVEGYRPH